MYYYFQFYYLDLDYTLYVYWTLKLKLWTKIITSVCLLVNCSSVIIICATVYKMTQLINQINYKQSDSLNIRNSYNK